MRVLPGVRTWIPPVLPGVRTWVPPTGVPLIGCWPKFVSGNGMGGRDGMGLPLVNDAVEDACCIRLEVKPELPCIPKGAGLVCPPPANGLLYAGAIATDSGIPVPNGDISGTPGAKTGGLTGGALENGEPPVLPGAWAGIPPVFCAGWDGEEIGLPISW